MLLRRRVVPNEAYGKDPAESSGGEGTQTKWGPSEGKPQACNIDELLGLGSGSPGVCTAPRPAGTHLLASDACLIAKLEELS